MKYMRKTFSLLLCAVLVLGMFTIAPAAAVSINAGDPVDNGPVGTIVFINGAQYERVVVPMPSTGALTAVEGMTFSGAWTVGGAAAGFGWPGGRVRPNGVSGHGGWSEARPEHFANERQLTLPNGAILESIRYYWDADTHTNAFIRFESEGNEPATIESNGRQTAPSILPTRQATGWSNASDTITMVIHNEAPATYIRAYILEFTYLMPKTVYVPSPVDHLTVTLENNNIAVSKTPGVDNGLKYAVTALTVDEVQTMINQWDKGVTNVLQTAFTFADLDLLDQPKFSAAQNGRRVIVVETTAAGAIIAAGVSTETINVTAGQLVFPDDYEVIVVNFGSHIPGSPGADYAGINWNTSGGGWTRVNAAATDGAWMALGGQRARPNAAFSPSAVSRIMLPEGAIFRSLLYYGNNATVTVTISSDGNNNVTATRGAHQTVSGNFNDSRIYTNWQSQSDRVVTLDTTPKGGSSHFEFYVWEMSYWVPKGTSTVTFANSMAIQVATEGTIRGDTALRGGTLKYALVEGLPTSSNDFTLRNMVMGTPEVQSSSSWIHTRTTSEATAQEALRALGAATDNLDLRFSAIRPVIGAGDQNKRLVVIEVDTDGFIIGAGASLAIHYEAPRPVPLTIAVDSDGMITGDEPTFTYGTTLMYAFVDVSPMSIINGWLLGETTAQTAAADFAVTFSKDRPSVNADDHNDKFLVVIEANDITGMVVAVGASSAIRVKSIGVTISDETLEGVGRARTISFVSEDSTEGMFLAVKITSETERNQMMILPLNGANSTSISYSVMNAVITVWITSGIPDLSVDGFGVIVYGTATTAVELDPEP